jgi:hypothetical protein
MAAFEQLVAPLTLPPRSQALARLWRDLLARDSGEPAGAPAPGHFRAVRLEGLYRAGGLDDMSRVFAEGVDRDADGARALIAALQIRHHLALGRIEDACAGTRALVQTRATLPAPLRADVQLLAGYCKAAGGNAAEAGLAAEIAREAGLEAPVPLAVLDSIAAAPPVADGQKSAKPNLARLALPDRTTVIDARFLALADALDADKLIDNAEPALLVALARDATLPIRLRVAAAEAGARVHAIDGAALASIYRESLPSGTPANAGGDAVLRRGYLLRAIEGEREPGRRLQLIVALMEDARRATLIMPLAAALAPSLADAGSGPLAAIAMEAALAAGDTTAARRFATDPALAGWRLLAEIADPAVRTPSADALAAAEDLARRNRFQSEALHRLVTILDAFDVNVPIPLWDAANRTPQPTAGFLPPSGTLSRLADAAKKGEQGHTVLLVLATIGPNGADAANLLSLGDAIRALRRAGLETDARRLALEALFPIWPRDALHTGAAR